MFAKFHEYNVHSMETRFKAQIDELFNAHSMRTRTKTLQLEEMSLSDLDNLFVLHEPNKLSGPKVLPSYVLVFDTETTGLIPKQLLPLQYKDLALYPYITQLSAVLYDVNNNKIKQIFNTYIKIPDHVVIPEIVTQITGITREKCNGGIAIEDALNQFYQMYVKCNAIAAHNMWFDSKMIRVECMRNRFPKMLGIFFKGTTVTTVAEKPPINCTMMQGMKYCGLNRFVKLSVLYEMLFKEDINAYGVQLHNSLVDTMVCLRCYLKIFCEKEISNAVFEMMIK